MSSEEEHIVYTQTIVPSTMRSTYWKYFGFPGNDNLEILTKSRVVCTICNKVISYNKNTSNLRTHLVAKHPEKMFELNNLDRMKTQNETLPVITLQEASKPRKLSIKKEKVKEELTDISIEVLDYRQIPNHDSVTDRSDQDQQMQFCYKKDDSSEIEEEEDGKRNTTGTMTEHCSNRDDSIEKVSFNKQILDIVIRDLVDPSCFYGREFQNFVNRNNFDFQRTTLESSLKANCEILNGNGDLPTGQYSLGLELFTNCYGTKYISIFITILKDAFLETKIFSIKQFENDSNIEELLAMFNLKNCSGVVLSSDCREDDLEAFFMHRSIPVIWCLHSILKRIVSKVFQMEEVSDFFVYNYGFCRDFYNIILFLSRLMSC